MYEHVLCFIDTLVNQTDMPPTLVRFKASRGRVRIAKATSRKLGAPDVRLGSPFEPDYLVG